LNRICLSVKIRPIKDANCSQIQCHTPFIEREAFKVEFHSASEVDENNCGNGTDGDTVI